MRKWTFCDSGSVHSLISDYIFEVHSSVSFRNHRRFLASSSLFQEVKPQSASKNGSMVVHGMYVLPNEPKNLVYLIKTVLGSAEQTGLLSLSYMCSLSSVPYYA